MFEKEISNYAFNVTKRYTGIRIPLNVLLSDPELPDNFKKFAESEVDEIIDREELGQSKTGRLDFSNQDIRALFKEIRHVLKNSFEFTREEFLEVADKASKFVFNYVIRPRWTLEKFIFKGEKKAPRKDVENALRFLSDYSYYPKGIQEYLDFHNAAELDLAAWLRLHRKMDEHLLGMTSSHLESLTAALFDLFNFSVGADKVPTDAMILFFRDKSDEQIVDRIEFAKDLKNLRALDLVALKAILEAAPKEVNESVEVLHPPEPPPKEFRTLEKNNVTYPLESHTSRLPKAEPEQKKDSENRPPVTPWGSPVDAARLKEPAPMLPALRSLITSKVEQKIVKRLFRGSRSSYQVAVHKLDECANWQDASRILEGIFIDNSIDPFSKYALAFTDVVSIKFKNIQVPPSGETGSQRQESGGSADVLEPPGT